MEYAIIETGGKQYKVTPGMKLEIDSLDLTTGETEFKNVLLSVSDSNVEIGKPFINGMVVKAKVLGAMKGEKLYPSKFKGKSRYRKRMGFRSQLTSIEILPFAAAKAKKSVSK